MQIFTKCRDDIARLRDTVLPGSAKGHLSDYLQLLFIMRRSIKQLDYEESLCQADIIKHTPSQCPKCRHYARFMDAP